MSDSQPSFAIGDALRFVQMSGIFYGLSELTEPWGLELPPMDHCVWFHAVTAGDCTIEVGQDQQRLEPGDFVLVPYAGGHRAWGRERTPTVPVFDLDHDYVNDRYAVLRHGGGGNSTAIVCGCIRFSDHPAVRELFRALPAMILMEKAKTDQSRWLRPILDLLADETRTIRPGSDAVISRLCDVVVMQSIRSWMEGSDAGHIGWLRALKDRNVGRVIAQIHANPAENWTVATLAAVAGLSRSAFAARFTGLVGEPAMRYVTRCRMHLAAELLKAGDATVAEVAELAGYQSEAAFSRAYKRITGVTPRGA